MFLNNQLLNRLRKAQLIDKCSSKLFLTWHNFLSIKFQKLRLDSKFLEDLSRKQNY